MGYRITNFIFSSNKGYIVEKTVVIIPTIQYKKTTINTSGLITIKLSWLKLWVLVHIFYKQN